MRSLEQIDALIAERDRLRAELDHAQTMLAESEAVIGMPVVEAIRAAVARVDASDPYALTDVVEQQRVTIIKLHDAFSLVARSRSEWRARAKRVDR